MTDAVIEKMTQKFGPLDFRSLRIPFHHTGYYEKEMGGGLCRSLISFENLMAPETLPKIKQYTNELENTFRRDNKSRRVNIDPGYIALCHLILATCKGFSHRPYLGRGVYADLTLIFLGNTFTSLPWTFPDYGSDELICLLNKIRSLLYQQLRGSKQKTTQNGQSQGSIPTGDTTND